MIFGINITSDISKLLYVISQAVRRVKFETILKYHKWYLCQILRTNHAVICLYYYPQKVCYFTCKAILDFDNSEIVIDMPVLSLKWLNLPQIIKLIKFNLFQTGLKQKIDFINYLSCVCSEKRCIKYIGHTHFTYKGWRRLSYPYLCSPWRKSGSIPAWLLFFSNITVKLTFLRMFSFVYNIGTIKMKWIRSASWPLL